MTRSSDLGMSWEKPMALVQNDLLVNLDAVAPLGNDIILMYTVEERAGAFQKYIGMMSSTGNLEATKLGELSIPDERNGWVIRAWPQGGDYAGLALSEEKTAFVVWSSAPSGLFRPFFTKVSFQ